MPLTSRLATLIGLLSFSLILLSFSGCSSIRDFVSSDSEFAVKIATAQVIYGGDAAGSEAVCERAFLGRKAIDEARALEDNPMLTLGDVRGGLFQIITESGLNPTYATILLDVADTVTADVSSRYGDSLRTERVALKRFIDVIDSVVTSASYSCN